MNVQTVNLNIDMTHPITDESRSMLSRFEYIGFISSLPYNCLYQNKGNNSIVNGSILTKLIRYREFMVLIICTKNESNLTNTYRDRVLDGQKVWTDGRNGQTDGRRQNYIPPTSSGDNYIIYLTLFLLVLFFLSLLLNFKIHE